MSDERLKERFARAMEAGRQRDYQRAVVILQEILLQTDQMPDVPLYLGRAYHAMGDFPRAIEALRYHLRLLPDSAQGHFFMGRACFALGLPAAALAHLRRSTELDGGFSPALGLLGLALLKLGQPRKAIAVFERALRIDPGNRQLFTGYLNAMLTCAVRLFFRRRYAEALEYLLVLREHRPDSLPVQLYLAGVYRELGEPSKALLHFGEASRLVPDDPVLYLQKAVIHLQQGTHPAAFEEMGKAMQLLGKQGITAQDSQDLLRVMTIVLFQNRRHREAVECARRVLRGSYQDADMHAIMAECFSHLGELAKAKNHYLRALERQRGRREFSYGLLSVLWQRQEYQELQTLLQRILKQDPADEYATYYHALCLPHLEAPYERTIPVLQAEIRRRGADPQLMHALGREYLRAKLPDLAEGWFRRTIDGDPLHESAWEGLLEVCRLLGNQDKLGTTLDRYLQQRPENLEARKEYARLLFASGRFAEAFPQLERVLPHEPRSGQLRRMLAHSYRQAGKYSEAVLLYREMLLKSPKDLSLLKPLLACLEAAGSRAAAVLLLEKAVKVFTKDASLLLHLGSLYVRQNDLEKAGQSFRGALALEPQSWQAHQSLGRLYRKMGSPEFAERFLKRARRLRAGPRTG
jgi:tetratricopeptide (TPR) repeat protein